jgi:hypothetical protein
LKVSHQPGGLYLGCRQIAMNPAIDIALDSNLSSIHSLFFDETLYLNDVEVLKQQMIEINHPRYLKTQGELVSSVLSIIKPHDFVELVFKSETESDFLKALNLLQPHSQKFILYALHPGLTRPDFESSLKQISKLAHDFPLVLEPDSDFVKMFEYQQLAQKYFSEVRVIPRLLFTLTFTFLFLRIWFLLLFKLLYLLLSILFIFGIDFLLPL